MVSFPEMYNDPTSLRGTSSVVITWILANCPVDNQPLHFPFPGPFLSNSKDLFYKMTCLDPSPCYLPSKKSSCPRWPDRTFIEKNYLFSFFRYWIDVWTYSLLSVNICSKLYLITGRKISWVQNTLGNFEVAFKQNSAK